MCRIDSGIPKFSVPTVGADGTVYVHADGIEGNTAATERLYGIDTSGSVTWCYKEIAAFVTDRLSSPVVDADGAIYFSSQNTATIKVTPTGTLGAVLQDSYFNSITSSPALSGAGVLYQPDVGMCAFETDGTPLWHASIGESSSGVNSSPSVGGDGTIYFVTMDTLFAINPDSTTKWKYCHGADMFDTYAAPALSDSGPIVSTEEKLVAVSWSGALRWEYYHGGYTSRAVAPTVDSRGRIYWQRGDNLTFPTMIELLELDGGGTLLRSVELDRASSGYSRYSPAPGMCGRGGQHSVCDRGQQASLHRQRPAPGAAFAAGRIRRYLHEPHSGVECGRRGTLLPSPALHLQPLDLHRRRRLNHYLVLGDRRAPVERHHALLAGQREKVRREQRLVGCLEFHHRRRERYRPVPRLPPGRVHGPGCYPNPELGPADGRRHLSPAALDQLLVRYGRVRGARADVDLAAGRPPGQPDDILLACQGGERGRSEPMARHVGFPDQAPGAISRLARRRRNRARDRGDSGMGRCDRSGLLPRPGVHRTRLLDSTPGHDTKLDPWKLMVPIRARKQYAIPLACGRDRRRRYQRLVRGMGLHHDPGARGHGFIERRRRRLAERGADGRLRRQPCDRSHALGISPLRELGGNGGG